MRFLDKKIRKNPKGYYDYEFNTGEHDSRYREIIDIKNDPLAKNLIEKETITYAAFRLDTSIELVLNTVKSNLTNRSDAEGYRLKFSEEESELVVQQLENLNRSIERNFQSDVAKGLKNLFERLALESVGVYYYAFYSSPQALYCANSIDGLSKDYLALKRLKGIGPASLEKARELLQELITKCYQEENLKLKKLLVEALGEANEELDKISHLPFDVSFFKVRELGSHYESFLPQRALDYYSFNKLLDRLSRLEVINYPQADFCTIDNYTEDGKIALDVGVLENSPEDLVVNCIYGFSLMLQDLIPRSKMLIEGVDSILESDFLNKLFNTMSYRLEILNKNVWSRLCSPVRRLFISRSEHPDLLEAMNCNIEASGNIHLFALSALIIASKNGDDIISNLNSENRIVTTEDFSGSLENLDLHKGKAAFKRAKTGGMKNDQS